MKKIILFAAVLFSAVSVVKAKDAPKATNEVKTKLSVILNPLQMITVGQSEVVLEYKNATDYAKGVTKPMKDHLNVYSTGSFTVSVNSDDDLKGVGDKASGKEIMANTISVKASKGSKSSGLILIDDEEVILSKSLNTLFTSDKGGIDLAFNVDYVGAGSQDYFDKLFNVSSASVFETTLTYTIAPK